MPGQPDVGDVHVNQPLSMLSIAYANAEDSFIADEVFPTVPVGKQSDIIAKYDRDMWLRSQAVVRAPGTLAARSGFTVNTASTYFARNFAIGMGVADEERDNADQVFNLDADAVEWCMQQILLAREVAFATAAFGTSKWTTDRSGTTNFTKWSDYANSTPIEDIRTYKRTVRQIIGRDPNVLAMGSIVWDRLADHPDMLDRIKGAASTGNPAIVTRQLVASVLELETVAVGKALQVTSAEGATEARADILDDDALLVFRPSSPSLKKPSGGYGFHWAAAVAPGAASFIRRYREDSKKLTVVEAHSYFDYKITAADAGLFLNDAVD